MIRQSWQRALTLSRKLCRVAPECGAGYLHAGFCLNQLGRTEEARGMLLKGPPALRREPIYYYNLGCYEALLGYAQDARRHLETSFRMDESFRELAKNDPDLKKRTTVVVNDFPAAAKQPKLIRPDSPTFQSHSCVDDARTGLRPSEMGRELELVIDDIAFGGERGRTGRRQSGFRPVHDRDRASHRARRQGEKIICRSGTDQRCWRHLRSAPRRSVPILEMRRMQLPTHALRASTALEVASGGASPAAHRKIPRATTAPDRPLAARLRILATALPCTWRTASWDFSATTPIG